MAERRMFSRNVVLSDRFLDLPATARCLYFYLGMVADDDGFVNSPKGAIRQSGASEDDLKLLVDGEYLLSFDSGVVLLRHWLIHNLVRKDRYSPTMCVAEKASVRLDSQKLYIRAKPGSFQPPTLEEVADYCRKRNSNVDPEEFYAHYDSLGWQVGNKPMRSWKSALTAWEARRKNQKTKKEDNPFLEESWLDQIGTVL